MNDGKIGVEMQGSFLPDLDPAVRYHAIKESNGRVSMEVKMTDVGIRVMLTCCACEEIGYLGAFEFAGTKWRSGKPFNNFLQKHKDCCGKTKMFEPDKIVPVEKEIEGRKFRGDD